MNLSTENDGAATKAKQNNNFTLSGQGFQCSEINSILQYFFYWNILYFCYRI